VSLTDTPVPLEQVGTPVPLWVAAFLLPLTVTPLNDGRNWIVDPPPFIYESALLQRIFVVPVGQPTDFASIPRLFWTLVGAPTGRYSRAAALHDDLYRNHGLVTRKQADDVLFEAMGVCRVPWLTKWLVYLGVRLGGASSYKGGL
jgi:hypothetical protein